MNEQNTKYLKACRAGDLETIKEFLSFEQDGIDYPKGFVLSCVEGKLEAVKLLLNCSIQAVKTARSFESACIHKRMDIIEYFIFDYKMRKDGAIEEIIIELGDPVMRQTVNHYFEMRELNKRLNNNLENKESSKPAHKI